VAAITKDPNAFPTFDDCACKLSNLVLRNFGSNGLYDDAHSLLETIRRATSAKDIVRTH
jgi:hypothetical protein